MTGFEIAGQIISIAAMGCNIISYQQKKESHLVACQLIGGALFSLSFFLLGATVGGLLNLVAAVRAVIFLFSEKLHASHPAWLCGFIACYVAFYILTFTVFGVEPKPITLLIEVLPVIGMTALSVGFMKGDSGAVRKAGLVSSPAWLIYNIYYLSIGAIICEAISLCSIFIGMLRHDRGEEKEDK
ncbi:MAG: YgjV family protein [Clostridia bacterium]|nr:YgjV family protein [Clostridia bacterium]